MGAAFILYAVIARDGDLRHRARAQGGAPMVYDTLAQAQRQARRPGDSVVECSINLDREPLFIRGNKIVVD